MVLYFESEIQRKHSMYNVGRGASESTLYYKLTDLNRWAEFSSDEGLICGLAIANIFIGSSIINDLFYFRFEYVVI